MNRKHRHRDANDEICDEDGSHHRQQGREGAALPDGAAKPAMFVVFDPIHVDEATLEDAI
jgi:hypothetical protein